MCACYVRAPASASTTLVNTTALALTDSALAYTAASAASAASAAPTFSFSLRLPDGRRLAYSCIFMSSTSSATTSDAKAESGEHACRSP